MWKCKKCGQTFSDSDSKCWACGTHSHGGEQETTSTDSSQRASGMGANSLYCSKCHKAYDNSWKVCLDCGATLSQGSPVKEPSVKEGEAPKKQVNWKTTVISVVSFIVIIFVGAIGKELGALLFKRPVASNTSINIESLNWQRRSLGIGGISLESPIELSEKAMRIPQQIMQYIKDTKSYDGAVRDLSITITMVQYLDTIQVNLEGAANGSIAELKQTVSKQGGTGFNYDTQRTYVSGKEAILVTAECTYPSINIRAKFRNIIFMDFPRVWIVQTIYKDNPNSATMAERIIGSIEKE